MTFATLRAEVFRRLQESATSPAFWTVADVDTVLNEGLAEMSDETEWYERSLEIDLLSKQRYYDLRTILPEPLLTIGACQNMTTQRWLTPATTTDLDTQYRHWERTLGEPAYSLVRGLWWLGTYPRPSADLGTMTLQYTALPDELAEDDDEPGFPDALHYGLVEYALAELWAWDAETTKASQAWAAYLAYETALRNFVGGRATVPAVVVMGSRIS